MKNKPKKLKRRRKKGNFEKKFGKKFHNSCKNKKNLAPKLVWHL